MLGYSHCICTWSRLLDRNTFVTAHEVTHGGGGGEEARNQFKFAGPAGVLNGLRFRAVWDLALGS